MSTSKFSLLFALACLLLMPTNAIGKTWFEDRIKLSGGHGSRAVKLINDANYAEALIEADKAVQESPSTADLLALRGKIFCILGSRKNAIKDFDRSIELDAKNEDLVIQKIYSLYQSGDLRRCEIDGYSAALKINPSSYIAYLNRGIAYGRNKQSEEAMNDFEKCFKIEQSNVRAYGAKADLLENMGQNEEALIFRNKALFLEPTRARYWDDRAMTYWAMRQFEKSLDDVTKAAELEPKNSYFQIRRAHILEKLGRYRDEVIAYDLAEKLGAPDILSDRACAKYDAGDYQSAISDWTFLIASYPDSSAFYLGKRAQAFARLKRYDAALNDLNKSLKVTQCDAFVYRCRAYVYYQQKNYEGAIADSTSVIDMSSKNQRDADRKYYSNLFLDRAADYRMVRKYHLAILDCLNAAALNSSNSRIYKELEYCIPRAVTEGKNKILAFLLFDALLIFSLKHLIFKRRIRRLL